MKKKRVIAFQEITVTKIIVFIVTLVFVAFAVKQFLSDELIPEFADMVKLFLGTWAVYGGKSGYEYSTRNRYGSYNRGYNNFDGGTQI